jgi:anaphase-promoting complex subunit 2
MIKDLSDSKRINNQCRTNTKSEEEPVSFPVDATITSYLFWPTFRDDKLELPSQIKEYVLALIPSNFMYRKLEKYSKSYESLKPTRQLVWKSHLGTVDIELEFEDQTLSFTVNPIQATVIYYFQEQSKYNRSGKTYFFEANGNWRL